MRWCELQLVPHLRIPEFKSSWRGALLIYQALGRTWVPAKLGNPEASSQVLNGGTESKLIWKG